MEQLIINIKDPAVLPTLRNMLEKVEGISVLHKVRKKSGTLDKALADVKAGRITKVGSVDELMEYLEA